MFRNIAEIHRLRPTKGYRDFKRTASHARKSKSAHFELGCEMLMLSTQVFLSLDGLCIMALGLGKLGALFFYRRIFCIKGLCDTFSVVSAAYIVTVAIWTVVFFVMTWNLCGHHSINWDVQVGHSAFCKLDYPYFKGSTISDFILEVFILSLPIPKVRSTTP